MQHLVFSLPANLQFGLLKHKGGQVTCQRSPRKWGIALGLNSGSTWFANFHCLVWMLPIHQPCSFLPTPQPTNPPNLLPNQVTSRLFTIYPAHTEFVKVKLQSVQKVCFECTKVGDQYPHKSLFCDLLSQLRILTDTLTDRKASAVPKQGLSQAGHGKKSHCSPNMKSLQSPRKCYRNMYFLSLGSLSIS